MSETPLTRRTTHLGQTRASGPGRAIKATLSSETPVPTVYPDVGQVLEILDHGPASIDLARAVNGRLPLLVGHDPAELPRPGNVEHIRLAGRRLRGTLRFGSSDRAAEILAAIDEGTLTELSIGYQVKEWKQEGTDPESGRPIVRATRWTLYECSLVNLPADVSVGVGRSLRKEQIMTTRPNIIEPAGEPEMTRDQRMRFVTVQRRAMELLAAHATGPEAPEVVRAVNATLARVLPDTRLSADEALDQVSEVILRAIQTRGPAQPGSEALDGMSSRDRSRYSVARAVQLQAERTLGRRERFDGLEAEVHAELLRGRPQSSEDHGGILIPWSMRSADDGYGGRRTMGTFQATGGATLVGQQTMPDMIDILRNNAAVLASGAKLYTGLSGNVSFNKATADPTVYWMDENPPADVPQSEPGYGYVTMSPKTLIGQVQVPKQLLVQSSIDIESDIRERLGANHALKLDLAAIHGLGSDKQPIGIWNQTGVLAHPCGGVPDLNDVVTIPALVAAKNADIGALAWLTTPTMAAVLQRTAVVDGQAVFIWNGTFREGTLNGFPARATNQVSSTLGSGADEHGLLFGNWRDLAIGIWGNELEVVVDVVTLAARAQIKITSYSMCDTGILRTDSFVKGTGAKVA